ncbi:olfactory receptor 14C36-like [Dasypus novemcinctus]|uniref:olfactory receptor 14C36-like n=1 Tax=Dasypus novemcinctus TaxID=9361 RepID=UPI00265FFD91|nr:olfactory receptor 14C36-like [Dasypus novemcinctus]
MVTEFLLMRFSVVLEYRVLHTILVILVYLATPMGNIFIVTVTTLDKNLHTPMYFFLRNLCVLDMCYISVTVPKACVIFLLANSVISLVGYAAQIFVFLFAGVELLFLTIMGHDHYVTICQPLHYTVIMNHHVYIHMTLSSTLCSVVFSGFHTGNTFWLSFCQSNVVHQFFCDIPFHLNLSCSDTLSNENNNFLSVVVIDGGCFVLIAMAYIHIFTTVLKLPTRGEWGKAFSTCIPNIIVLLAQPVLSM